MNAVPPDSRKAGWPVYRYFTVVMACSAPLWLVAFITDRELLPGLPASSLMVFVPGLVALVLVALSDGRTQARIWLRRAFKLPRPFPLGWFGLALALPAVIMFAAYLSMRLLGYELPAFEISATSAVTLLALFLIPAVFEELGWSCFALVALIRRMSALSASLIIGIVWATWHVIPLIQAERAFDWIVWWCLTTVALRVLLTWIFNNTSRTVIAVALFHAAENVAWQSFPVSGSHYDPAIHSLCLWLVCAAVIARFGWRTLTRNVRN